MVIIHFQHTPALLLTFVHGGISLFSPQTWELSFCLMGLCSDVITCERGCYLWQLLSYPDLAVRVVVNLKPEGL